MRAGGRAFFRHFHIVSEIVFLPFFIEQVARVTKRHFREFILLAHFINRDRHMIQIVQAVKDTENIDAVFRRLRDEVTNNGFVIIRIAYRIRAAGQHLE